MVLSFATTLANAIVLDHLAALDASGLVNSRR
jgi:predicted transcriptional regulator